MSKNVIHLSKNELKKIINESIREVIRLTPIEEDMIHKPLMEGLIVSYPSERVINHLIKTFTLSNDIFEYMENPYSLNTKNGVVMNAPANSQTDVIMVAIRKFPQDFKSRVVDVMTNLCGWQLGCAVNNTRNIQVYPDWFSKTHWVLQFEKKFDNIANDIVFSKGYLYHVCPSSRLKKIMEIGLTPKDSTWKQYNHNDRIYFYLEKPDMNFKNREFGFEKNTITDNYVLLRINVKSLPEDMNFYFDPRQPDAVVTNQNVPPIAITIEE